MSRHRLPSLLLLVGLVTTCSVADSNWVEVKTQLSAIREKDKQYRTRMDSIGLVLGWQSPLVEELWEKQHVLDSINLVEVDEIITRYGYPPKDRVGDLSDVPFDVIRHSDPAVMATYLEIVVGAGRNGDLRMDQVATFEDRVRISQRQPQEYGTQIWIDFIEKEKTQERYDSIYLWPVRDRENIDARRHSVGLDSLNEHLMRYGIDPTKGYLLRKSPATP